MLIAMLAGGDYKSSGLPGCGPKIALIAVRSSLGKSLCNAKSQEDCHEWRTRVLVPFFKMKKVHIDVPSDFPSFKVLQWYNKPKILTDTAVVNNPELQQNSMQTLSERDLLMVTSHRFNTWGKDYMKWIGPTMLTQYLVATGPFSSNPVPHGIRLVKQKKGKKKGSTELGMFRTHDHVLTNCLDQSQEVHVRI